MKEKDCSPDLVTYNLIIGGLLEQGEVDEVFNLKNEMVATGIKVDVETFICIIKGLCKLGEFKDAIKLLGGMKDDGVLPDANCYYPIIRDLCKAKRIEEVWDLIAQMVENGVKPNSCTFGTLRSAFATKKNVTMYFKKSIDHGIIPDKGILATLFEGACGRGNTRGVLSIMINVIDDSILGDSLHIYNELIQRLLQCDKMHLAMELLSEIHKKELIPDCNTYSYLIFGFIDKGNEEKAHLLFNEMQQRSVCPNDVTFSKMLQTRLPSRRKILVKRWLQVMKKKEGVTLV
ncbi:pentatricopeptide repeat-containing protein [Tanacetum coccineum]